MPRSQWIRAGLFADTLTPNVTLAILAALAAWRGQTAGGTDVAGAVSLGALETAIATGGVEAVLRLVFSAPRTDAALGGVRDALGSALTQSGRWWVDDLPRFTVAGPPQPPRFGALTLSGSAGAPREVLRVRFDAVNPRAVDAMRTLEGTWTQALTTDAQAGVRTALADAVAQGLNPRASARALREVIGLPASMVKQVGTFRAELATIHERRALPKGWGLGKRISRAPGGAQTFAVDAQGKVLDGITERRLRDFRYDGKLVRAIQTNTPLPAADIDRMVAAYERKLRSFHAVTVSRTATLDALAQGQRLAWEEVIAKGGVRREDLRRFWKTAGDDRVRITHREIPKLNPRGVGFDEPFDTPDGPVAGPPLGFNCRCVVVVRTVVRNAIGEVVR